MFRSDDSYLFILLSGGIRDSPGMLIKIGQKGFSWSPDHVRVHTFSVGTLLPAPRDPGAPKCLSPVSGDLVVSTKCFGELYRDEASWDYTQVF